MKYEIKISGIDENKNKSIWLNLKETEDLRFRENEYIRKKENNNLEEEFNNTNNKLILNKNIILEGNNIDNKIKKIIELLEKEYKKICICGYENLLNYIKENYILELKKKCKYIDLLYNDELFNIKEIYNIDGSIEYIINKKNKKIYEYDLIIIDEICIDSEIYCDFIKTNIEKMGILILLRNNNIKTSINLVDIISKENIINIKDNNEYLNNEKIIKKDIKKFNEEYILNKENSILLEYNLKEYNIPEKNDLNINDIIIYKLNGINAIYKLEKIENIKLEKKIIKKVDYKDLIKINKSKKILLSAIKKKYENKLNYYDETMEEYNSQQYLNYIIYELKISKDIENIFNIINNIKNIEIYVIKTYNKEELELIVNKEIINNNIKLLKEEIGKLYDYLRKKKNKSYINYIIKGLWELINILLKKDIINEYYKKEVFIKNIDLKNINKIITFKIKNIFINVENVIEKNKELLYNCVNLNSEKIYILKENYKII